MRSQNGFTSIALIIFGVLVTLGMFVFIFVIVKPFNTTSDKLGNKNTASQSQNDLLEGKSPEITCQSKDLGGCDTEKNFYKWKDDGKP